MSAMTIKNLPADVQSAFHQFARNGRWGTCVECPRDVEGHVYNEDGDLFVAADDLDDIDRARVLSAFREIRNYHADRGAS